ncbi:MAG TPA: DUF2625 family protein [Pyrinomonadaceae bacterium]|nr:DUF2625 family protein [Pyrinomonadaceae bacterium]
MSKRKLDELIVTEDPAIKIIEEWVNNAPVPCELLPPSPEREDALLYTQVTTHSSLGAMAYDSGGLLIDDGWVRFLGSGHAKLERTLHGWNATRTDGTFMLVGDDAAGGFFALNGGALGEDLGSMYYLSPDSLEWESLEAGFTDVVAAFLTDYLEKFYKMLRWSTWRDDVRKLSSDRCYFFFPFLWTKQGSIEGSDRSTVPINENWNFKVESYKQVFGYS